MAKGRPRKWQYLADYRCGCTDVQDRRSDLLEYCGKHGENRRRIYTVPIKKGQKPMEKGLA